MATKCSTRYKKYSGSKVDFVLEAPGRKEIVGIEVKASSIAPTHEVYTVYRN